MFLLTFTLIEFCYAQNIGQEYSGFKVYKNVKRALKNKSEVVVLDISNKRMISLPENIGELQALKVLKLSGNKIQSFPESFWQLNKLEVLNISNNSLLELPENIGSLKGLKKLYLSRNHISSIPHSVTFLRELQILDLTFNDLRDSDADFIRKSLPSCSVVVYMKF